MTLTAYCFLFSIVSLYTLYRAITSPQTHAVINTAVVYNLWTTYFCALAFFVIRTGSRMTAEV